MSTGTSIEWTDATWNPLRGTIGRHHCVRCSPGCKNCYAATMNRRFKGPDYVVDADTSRFDEQALLLPLSWRKPRRVFVCSMTDLFLEAHSDEWIDRVFAVMALCPQHTFQVLTKRAERMREYMTSRPASPTVPREVNISTEYGLGVYHVPWPFPNVWMGVSCEDQQRADERIPHLLQTPAAIRWVSAEPLLGPLNLIQFMSKNYYSQGGRQWIGAGGLHWLVAGGESGHGARESKLEWYRSLHRQCRDAGVGFFLKQLGAKPYERTQTVGAVPAIIKLRDRKGGDINEFPLDLRVREWPVTGNPPIGAGRGVGHVEQPK